MVPTKSTVAGMTFAAVIGSYDLPDFVRLQILSLRHVFGDIPVLVSDDISPHSPEIRDIAAEFAVHHVASGPRGHFAGDCQAAVNGLAFAQCEKADILLKVSQRFVLCSPLIRQILERYFANPDTWLLLPGRIHPASIKRAESRFFSNLSVQSDIVCLRSDKITPLALKELYESRLRAKQSRHDSLIEALWAFIMDVTLAGHAVQAPELTHHPSGHPKLFLRRCQSEPAEYQKLAAELGMKDFLPLLQEWRQLTNSYRPVPVFL
jgi:hypothetical protein